MVVWAIGALAAVGMVAVVVWVRVAAPCELFKGANLQDVPLRCLEQLRGAR